MKVKKTKMSELNKKIKTIINDLEKNIENKEELDYVKNQVYNVALLFVEEIDKLMQMIVDNGENIMQVNSNLDSRMSKIEKKLQNIEKEFFLEDEFDFEITCPYLSRIATPTCFRLQVDCFPYTCATVIPHSSKFFIKKVNPPNSQAQAQDYPSKVLQHLHGRLPLKGLLHHQ